MLGEYSEKDGEILIKLARKSIESGFSRKNPEIPEGKQFKQARGVFVTLTKKGKLRGCIGFPYPTLPISNAIIEAAKSAAFLDSRFNNIKEEELKEIKIEISVLTSPQPCNAKDIQVGKDGIMCNYIGYSGLLLPQVAIEYKMSRIQFLESLAEKAGLPKDTWQNKNFKLYKFQCQIFSEMSG